MTRFWPRTIRAKLTLTAMLVMGTLLAGLGVLVDFSARRAMIGSIDEGLRQRAETMDRMGRGRGMGPGMGMGRGGPMGDPPPFRPPPTDPIRGGAPRMLRVGEDSPFPNAPFEPYDLAGFRAALNGAADLRTIVRDNEPIRLISQPVWRDGRLVGVVQLPYAMGEVVRSLDDLRTILLRFVVTLGVALTGLASLFLVGRLMRPLRMITEEAEAIGAGDLSRRLPVVGRDEFATLGTTLNGMLGRLQQALEAEQETTRQLRRFTADASHELKTPLSVIKANTGLLLHMSEVAGEDRRSVEAVDAAADRMNRLVQGLLVLARSDSGHMNARGERLDLAALVQNAVDHVVGPTVAQVPEHPVWVEGSSDDLGRVFSNLLDNAHLHSDSSEPVRITVTPGATEVVVEVQDSGVGIAPEHLPHVFERFYRIDSSRTTATGGNGLGLAICQSIVEAHGGSIAVASQVGQGTTFTVRLPLAG